MYTWVNGSDPRWLAKKEKWLKPKHNQEESAGAFNSTSPLSNHTLPLTIDGNATLPLNESTTEIDDTMSSNRYRDSEELRFSLRSLVKNAPWIRHIYIVTDNQVSTTWAGIEIFLAYNQELTQLTHLHTNLYPYIQ